LTQQFSIVHEGGVHEKANRRRSIHYFRRERRDGRLNSIEFPPAEVNVRTRGTGDGLGRSDDVSFANGDRFIANAGKSSPPRKKKGPAVLAAGP
jgi:hypothetical protein